MTKSILTRLAHHGIYPMAIVIVVMSWHMIARVWDSPFIPLPRSSFERIYEWLLTGQLRDALGETLLVFVLGFGLGCIAAIVLATSLVWTPRMAGIVEPYVMAVYATPKVALLPLLFIWLGRGMGVGALFVSMGAFAIVFASIMTGLRTITQRDIQVLLLMGASRTRVTRMLLVPQSLGYLAAGITVAGPFALLTTILVEMLLVTRGIGGMLVQAAGVFDAVGVFAATVVASVLGVLILTASTLLASRSSQWRYS
jgi:NitT/TauT family transport system permease protein